MRLKEIFYPKILECLRGYDRGMLTRDAVAGVIVCVVNIPLSIAFGIASGVGPTEGLVTSIVAGLLIALLGGSKVQIGGPTGAFIILIYSTIQQFGVGGLLITTLMAGILLILLGVLQLGTVIKFVPYPVIVGFTAGIALTIFSTQMNDFFGLGIASVPSDFVEKWICYFSHISQIHWWSFGVAIFSLLVMIFSPRWFKRVPGSLLAIVLSTVIVLLLKRLAHIDGITTIGDLYALPSGLPMPSMPSVSLPEGMSWAEYIRMLFPSAFTIAMLGAIESLLSAMVADGAIGDKHDSNTELIGQGIANVITPFFGGLPATGAIARTMANINNGGRTPVAGVINAVSLLLMLLLLGPLVGMIPMPCLASVLIMVAYNMSGWRTIVGMSKNPTKEFGVLILTFLLTVIFDLTVAIAVGMLLSLVLFLQRISQTTSVKIFNKEIDPNADSETSQHEEHLLIPEGVEVYEIDGPYFFGIANKFDDMVQWSGKMPKVRIIRMRKVPFIDSTGIHNLEMLCQRSLSAGTTIVLSGVKKEVHETLREANFEQMLGAQNICPNINVALKRAQEIMENAAVEAKK